MHVSRDRVSEVGRALVHEARTEKVTFLAGSIAYHAFLSILPLLLLLLAALERTESVALRDSIVAVLQVVLTPQAGAVIQQGLAGADSSVSLLGAGVLVWGAMRIFRGLDTAFSDIYETERANTFLDQLGDALLILVTVALFIVVVSAAGGLVSVDGTGLVPELLRRAVTAAGLSLVLYPMYYVFPDADCTPLEVLPGTAFAAVGVTVAQVVFTTVKSGGDNLVASILLVLTWLYVVGLVILLGVVLNAVLSNRSQDVSIRPVLGTGPAPDDRSGTVDRAARQPDVEAVAAALRERDAELLVRTGGDELTVPAPDRVDVENESAVDGLDDSVGLTLRWRGD